LDRKVKVYWPLQVVLIPAFFAGLNRYTAELRLTKDKQKGRTHRIGYHQQTTTSAGEQCGI
jgi:hypothetical protein